MTTSQDLLQLVFNALAISGDSPAPTAAGSRVYMPGDWPTQSGQYPIIKLRLATENRVSMGRNTLLFTTTATVQIIGEVAAPAQPGNAGATAAETALWALKRQIEIAVINSYPLMSEIQQFPTINSSVGFDSSGEYHIGTLGIELAMEFVEDADNFAPIAADDLEIVTAEDTNHAPVGFELDNLQQ